MSGLRQLFSGFKAMTIVLVLCTGLGTASAVDDQFSAEIGLSGEVVSESGTGFNHGSWYYYPNSDWLAQWFYNDAPDPDGRKVISLDLTVDVFDPTQSGDIEVAVNWTSLDWPSSLTYPPQPAHVPTSTQEQRYIVRQTVIQRTDVRGVMALSAAFEIADFCPQWVSIDLRVTNVVVDGVIRHECISGQGTTPASTGDRDFGDAPEGSWAYVSPKVQGLFPTCVSVGPAAWIEHNSQYLYFGPKVDVEAEGNGGKCPLFTPNQYNGDEKQLDGDAGLTKPRAYTITGPSGSETIGALNFVVLESLGTGCLLATWGATIDMEVHNQSRSEAYVNVLFDWNHDGKWQGSAQCSDGPVPEHAVVNFPVPAGYNGLLSALQPPSMKIGPLGGYVWARFTISDRRVLEGWNGDGVFSDGETEDYLLYVHEPLDFCEWDEGDPHKMHWAQLPDKQRTALDVDMYWTSLADDFQCAQSGPIMEIHFWASYLDDLLPEHSVDSLAFVINIYANVPADDTITWSRPGQRLWTKQIPQYSYNFHELGGSTLKGWFDPVTQTYLSDNHERTFRYDICFDEDDPNLFIQRQGGIYWIEIKQVREEELPYTFGWRTTQQRLQYNDKAVWKHATLGWRPMTYPHGHEYDGSALDLAFVITGPDVPDTDYGDAPDPTYPTLSISNGASHVIVSGVHLGNLVDGEFDGRPNATATGDDEVDSDDEDGVTFSSFVVGDVTAIEVTATVQGVLNAWIDWNADGDWQDAGEHVFVDRTLSAGVNSLSLVVPAGAMPGETFARFRFSTVRGLDYDGPAADGEVEDYMIRVQDTSVPTKPPLEHTKWSQPPIEYDPASRTPVYCGWDQPAYVVKPSSSSSVTWHLVADDFRCIGDMPVTTVHWWGSYQAWNGDEPPRTVPTSWRIAFWNNVAADTRYAFSRPEKLLWVVNVPASRVAVERVGTDVFPRKASDTAFQYLLELQSQEYFAQGDFVDTDARDRIFWISITAVYSGSTEPEYPWGWKTRPQSWMDAAVKADTRRDDLRAGISLDASVAQPITDSVTCQRLDNYDMTFELATDTDFIKWEQPFTGLRNWAHYEDEQSMAVEGSAASSAKWTQSPDTTSTGVDVDITTDIPPTWPATIGADDFQCTTTGPITKITLWGSWFDDILPSGSAENVKFTLSIREDISASRSSTGFSMPGSALWRKEFSRGEFTAEPVSGRAESYYSPVNDTYEAHNHLQTYKYTFTINSAQAFRQTGTASQPVVYWLAAQASLIHSPGSVATRFGWATSTSHWNDDAVWGNGTELFLGPWNELRYPRNHSLATRSIDLAFAVETADTGGLTLQRVVADDWRCNRISPITGIVWWGSYIGYRYLPCQCSQMTGPRKPDYFMLSIWTDQADSTKGFNHPGQKLWEYRAEEFEEVLVGFDKHPESTSSQGFEPVYRYSVRVPQDQWYVQDGRNNVLWLSVVAVYEDSRSIVYPWGWTNHPHEGWDLSGIDMAGHWKLDESSGTVASDSSGNGNHGTVAGSAVWRPTGGWIGGALDFDGRNDCVTVSRPAGLNFAPNSFSVAAWIYPRETRGLWRAIIEYDRNSVNGNRFGLWLDLDGRLHFRVGQNTWQSPSALTANQWSHVAGTYDATTRAMDIYVDGQLVATATQQRGYTTATLAALAIGACGTGDDEFFNGLIDDVRVFTSALSDDDVLTLAGAGGNSDAVAADLSGGATTPWPWVELLDQTRESEDMSFMLFTHPWLLITSESTDQSGQPKEEKK